ncbi:uncharacterized protein PV07_11274 [Cladophialophora immunda]|uniref:3-oxoacyl-[acyl-carrier protein] reductase n=1 Tax=Cladophialophora immunda TaxID=569365 RepID=A0A0D2ADT5_9EURO|nr:uncharacterized protein PV07_11274 [Cladophialophora immunda]KIW23042.1 hypothetical protein PV07_11274 [Cladophialophora immunda]
MALALTFSTGKAQLDDLIRELQLQHLRGGGARLISAHQANLEAVDDIDRLFSEIRQAHGKRPDVLVANAGYAKVIPNIADIPLEEFDRAMAVNLRATFLLVKLALPAMVEQGWGRIVFVSSIAAEGGGINGCHYAASKAGMNGMMRNLATKLGRHGITVNSLAPAMIGATGLIPDESILKGTPGDVVNIPVGRLGTPQECANVIEMICTTGYLTGQNILLTGGLK